MQFWTFLHIASMFAAVTVAWGSGAFVVYAFHQRDVPALRIMARLSGRADALSGSLAVLGVAFGLIAATVGGLNLLTGWLVLAYLLAGLALVSGYATVPFSNRLMAAAKANEGDEPGPELELLFESRIPYAYLIGGVGFIVAIIAVMVFKPSF